MDMINVFLDLSRWLLIFFLNLLLFCGFLPWIWDISADVLVFLELTLDYEIIRSLIFVLIFMFLSKIISIPFDLYSTFVIEAKHEFNKQSFSLYFYDLFMEMILAVVIITPIVSGFIKLIQWGGTHFYIHVFLFLLVVQVIMLYLIPNVIQPLFNKFVPLEEGELKKRIEELAKKLSFPLKEIFVMDGSKRSDHSNAYFFGFWKNKRIVLFDTLLQKVNQDEIIAVLCHELGHWNYSHMLKMLFITEIHTFILLYLFSLFIHTQELYNSFGFHDKPIIIGFILFSLVYSPIENIMSFFMHVISRKHEFEADVFACLQNYGADLISGLIKLHKVNKSNIDPDKWYAMYHYTHPPLLERINALEELKKI